MQIQYGCECGDCAIHDKKKNSEIPPTLFSEFFDYPFSEAKSAPVVRQVNRDGRIIKVCSRCTLSGDKLIEFLISKDMDRKPFEEFDSMGAEAEFGDLP